MKQSQRRYFNQSACDCRECSSLKAGFKQAGYMVLVFVVLSATFGTLFIVAQVLFPSTQIVK